MNGQTKDRKAAEEQDFEDTEQLSLKAAANTDNVGETSVEIDVDELISEVEAAGLPTDHFKGKDSRRKLEEILEEKRMSKDASDFEDFGID